MTEDRSVELGETSESRPEPPEPAVDGSSGGQVFASAAEGDSQAGSENVAETTAEDETADSAPGSADVAADSVAQSTDAATDEIPALVDADTVESAPESEPAPVAPDPAAVSTDHPETIPSVEGSDTETGSAADETGPPDETSGSTDGPAAFPASADSEPTPLGAPEAAPTVAAEEDPPAGTASGPATAASVPTPPRPTGRPAPGRPRPGGPVMRHPSPTAPTSTPGSAPGHAPAKEQSFEPVDPHQWGRIDENGVVYVYSASTGERPVGNWQAGDVEAGLAHFGRRFDDFVTEVALLETRLATGSGDPKATKQHAVELRDSVDSLAAVGDFDSAAIRLEVVIGAADVAIAGASKARAAARARAVAAKEALCVEAEELAESTAWKTTGDRLKAIVDEWRTIHGIDRKTDDALWKRFAKARDTFTRHRGTHFADLDKQRASARETKEQLISKAEELSASTEWGKTAGEYRQLMEQWKASGRAPRDIEDELWDRFRAAQEKFFARRNETFNQRDTEFETNAATKEKLLAEAEKIDPARNLDGARAALRSVQERWEAAGKVPRERIREFEGRLRAVEDRIKKAEDSHWRRTDPETAARIEQFRSRAESFRQQGAKARAAGDERKAAQADAQARQWEEWLAAAEGATS